MQARGLNDPVPDVIKRCAEASSASFARVKAECAKAVDPVVSQLNSDAPPRDSDHTNPDPTESDVDVAASSDDDLLWISDEEDNTKVSCSLSIHCKKNRFLRRSLV